MELFVADIPTWALLVTILLTLLSYYFTRHFNYWKTQGIPYVTRYPIIGGLNLQGKKHFHAIELERYKKYGRLYGTYEGPIPILSCAEPDLLRDVLVKDFNIFPSGRDFTTGEPVTDHMLSIARGETWKRMRTMMSPGFTLRKLRIVCDRLKDCSKSLIENFRNAVKQDSTVECRGFLDSFAMDVMSSCMFGTRIESYQDPNNEFLEKGRKAFTLTFDWKVILAIAFPKLARYLGFAFFNQEGLDYYKALSKGIIKERKESGKRRNDFLQLLIDANEGASKPDEEEDKSIDIRDESIEIGQDEDIKKKVFQQSGKNKSMSDVEILSQSVQFLMASFEGAGATLALICHSLAKHPDCQEKLIQEIDEAFHRNGEIDYTVIRDMTYLDGVVKETMRVYPPLVRIERMAKEDYKLGDTGIIIPKGGLITVPIHAMQHDPDYFPEPENFNPERFSPENKHEVIPYTYLPFGAGPRNCLGMRLVLLEVKYGIILLFRHFRLSFSPETMDPLNFDANNFLLSPRKMKLTVEPRKDIPSQ